MPHETAAVSARSVYTMCQRCKLSLAGAATSIIFVARNTSFVATKVCLTNICLDKHNFVLLLRQTRVCTNKTRLLSRQKYACLDKSFVATNTVMFVATGNFRDKHNFVATKDVFCGDKHMSPLLMMM